MLHPAWHPPTPPSQTATLGSCLLIWFAVVFFWPNEDTEIFPHAAVEFVNFNFWGLLSRAVILVWLSAVSRTGRHRQETERQRLNPDIHLLDGAFTPAGLHAKRTCDLSQCFSEQKSQSGASDRVTWASSGVWPVSMDRSGSVRKQYFESLNYSMTTCQTISPEGDCWLRLKASD